MDKIKTFTEIQQLAIQFREANKTIVCTCGCFDLLHIGHVEHLEESRSLGDILIVGINADWYIEKIKSRELYFHQNDRCRVLASLSCVDYVFVFEQETFSTCLKTIHPHYFTKGIDRLIIQEQRTADELGIQVKITGQSKRSSSSDIYRKLLSAQSL